MIAAVLMAGACSPAAARKPPVPTGTLTLDMDDPTVTVDVAGTPLRLRVGLEHKDVIELNPAAAARLPLPFEPGFDAQVGRERLSGIAAGAEAAIDGRRFLALVASHGRDCCAGVDGAIGVGLLPYASVLFRRAQPTQSETRTLAMAISTERGLESAALAASPYVTAQFSLERADSVATAAAGVILARAHGGTRDAGYGRSIAAFGISRPVQTVRFARPVTIAGFSYDALITRTADFAGRNEFPRPAGEAGDIVVNRKRAPQDAWPVVLIGRDRLDRCDQIRFDRVPLQLSLRCQW